MKNVFLLLTALVVISACRHARQNRQLAAETGLDDSTLLIRPQYAQGFTVKYLADGVRLVEVVDPQKQDDGERMPIGYAFALVQRVREGRIQKIGMEGNFDTELILAANPDVIFISPFKRGGYDTIKETGITLIPHLGYKEQTPLGQAERGEICSDVCWT